MWDELVGIQQYWRLPWCYFGDFNIVRFPSEHRGETRLTLAMEKFSEFIEDLNLVDLPLEGGRYTWSSGTDRPAMSRLIEFWSPQIRRTISQMFFKGFYLVLSQITVQFFWRQGE